MTATPILRQRTLSKSDYKLAHSCEAKLYFLENGYPDRKDWDPYLQMLARGGYMVEALAKAHHPDDVQLEYRRVSSRGRLSGHARSFSSSSSGFA